MTTLADLEKDGGFVSDKPVKKSITWDRAHVGKDTVILDVWVRPMTDGLYERLISVPHGQARIPLKISELVSFGPDGKEKMTPERAALMDLPLLMSINTAIDDLTPTPGKA
jgi:hypothetical protein